MKDFTRLVSELNRPVLAALLFVALPSVACNNSDSIGRFADGGSTGSGGSLGGTGGVGAGGAPSGVGGAGLGGSKTGQGGGSGGAQTGVGGSGAVGSGGQGGRDAASDAYPCVITNVYCPYGYVLDANGCSVCAPGTGGAGGAGGTTGMGGATSDAAGKLDVQVSSDAQDLAALCTSTGGQIDSTLCCTSAGDFPDSCLVGACGCAPTSSHSVATCTCPTGSCFSPKTGCGPRGGGTGGSGGGGGNSDAAPDVKVVCGSATCTTGEYCCNALANLCAPLGYGCAQGSSGDAAQNVDSGDCTARPEGDSTMCGGTNPPHYYTCILAMLAAPCTTLNIGDVTNGFCCP